MDGVAFCVLGMGKVNAAFTTMAVLSDGRFDYSQAYFLSTGCAGSTAETTVMGDVFLSIAAVDYDLGHRADGRDLADPEGSSWFHDADNADEMMLAHEDSVEAADFFALSMKNRISAVGYAMFPLADAYIHDPQRLQGIWVFDDEFVKGFINIEGKCIAELYVDSFFENQGIGSSSI